MSVKSVCDNLKDTVFDFFWELRTNSKIRTSFSAQWFSLESHETIHVTSRNKWVFFHKHLGLLKTCNMLYVPESSSTFIGVRSVMGISTFFSSSMCTSVVFTGRFARLSPSLSILLRFICSSEARLTNQSAQYGEYLLILKGLGYKGRKRGSSLAGNRQAADTNGYILHMLQCWLDGFPHTATALYRSIHIKNARLPSTGFYTLNMSRKAEIPHIEAAHIYLQRSACHEATYTAVLTNVTWAESVVSYGNEKTSYLQSRCLSQRLLSGLPWIAMPASFPGVDFPRGLSILTGYLIAGTGRGGGGGGAVVISGNVYVCVCVCGGGGEQTEDCAK